MKLNFIDNAKAFRELPTLVIERLIVALNPDKTGRLFKEFLQKTFDQRVLAEAPLFKRIWFQIQDHPALTTAGLIGTVGTVLGFDAWNQWGGADDVLVPMKFDVIQIGDLFRSGELTKEEALELINNKITLAEIIIDKMQLSETLNPITKWLTPSFLISAEESFDRIKLEKELIETGEAPPPPEEAITITNLDVFPTVTQIGTSVTLSANIQNTSPNDILTNVEFVVVKPDGTSPITTIENVSIPASFSNSATFILETADFPEGFYNVNIGVFEVDTNATLATKNFANAFQLTAEEPSIIPPEEQVATLIIEGLPLDAKIEVGNRPEITSQGTFEVPAGNYEVRASKEGFKTFQSTFFLDVGDERTFGFNLLPIDVDEPKGSITINTNPQGAKVSIDGLFEFDVTPLTVFQISGDHLVRLTLDDHEPIEQTLTWEDNVNKEQTFNLTPIIPEAELTPAKVLITSEPTGAGVTINGEFKFTITPFTAFLDAGTYLIRVELEGFLPLESEITVKSDDDITLPFILTTTEEGLPPEPIPTPDEEIPESDLDLLDPLFIDFTPLTEIPPVVEKELLINIETTDLNPWDGNIYSIAMLELDNPDAAPIILVDNNEQNLVQEFSNFFETGKYTKLVGFKTTFDHRYIFSKLMLYRIKNKAFVDVPMRDIKQIMDQVQEQFVYFPSKTGTLDDWGKHLFGVGKFGDQETLLREYIAGNLDYVRSFQTRQIELEANLYALARFVASESPETGSSHLPEEGSSHIPTFGAGIESDPPMKECKNCVQMNPLDATECLVCGDKL